MKSSALVHSFSALLLLALGSGCATWKRQALEHQVGESVVLVGEEPAALAHVPIKKAKLSVRSTYLPQASTIEYQPGRDFWFDARSGTLRRTAGSRMPDFRTNVLFGAEGFDHNNFPGFGNTAFFAFVDYSYQPTTRWPVQANQVASLPKTKAKLQAGASLKIVAYGDSITAGGDATRPEWIFWRRWADHLQTRYPQAHVEAINGATGGDSTFQGLQRLEAKVLKEKPDLVLVGFGMNDHNIGGPTIPVFEKNLKDIIAQIRQETSAEIVLYSTFPPNEKWKYGSHRMPEYAAATERVAREVGCAFADVFNNWQAVLQRKKPEDILGNNINHPNDFGHWVYFQVLLGLGL